MSGTYNRKDHFYQRAKDEGFASRAAFKLKELDKRFGILKQRSKILDLGAWPGGWMQVAAAKVGRAGVVVGIDLVELEGLDADNVFAIKGDVRDEEILKQAQEYASGEFDVVLSDMSPKISGIREVDNIATVGCAELALFVAQQMLREGGILVIKLFMSNESNEFVRSSRVFFNKVQRVELDSTRSTSKEFYFVGQGFKRPVNE